MTTTPPTALVIGATGKTGRRVARLLVAAGMPVRPASRPQFEWTDRTTWQPTLTGATSAYIAYSPDLAFPGAPETVAELVALAGRTGVSRVVLLSGRNEAEAQRAEVLLQLTADAHDIQWAVVRSAFFWQNFTEDLFAGPIAEGRLRFLAGDVREPFVDAGDVAEVAAAVLLGHAPTGRVYEVTGPRLLTFAEAVREVGDAAGIEVEYEQITAPELVDDLATAGLDRADAEAIVGLFAEVLDGRNASLAGGIRDALARAPREFPEREPAQELGR